MRKTVKDLKPGDVWYIGRARVVVNEVVPVKFRVEATIIEDGVARATEFTADADHSVEVAEEKA